MNIFGIVLIVKIKRIKSLVKDQKFINRVFAKNEIIQSKNIKKKVDYFSKRFAAKEALAKALGTGFRNNLNLKDIEILNDKLGKPYYIKTQKLSKIIYKNQKIKKYNLFLSISDEKDYSIAFAIVQKL